MLDLSKILEEACRGVALPSLIPRQILSLFLFFFFSWMNSSFELKKEKGNHAKYSCRLQQTPPKNLLLIIKWRMWYDHEFTISLLNENYV